MSDEAKAKILADQMDGIRTEIRAAIATFNKETEERWKVVEAIADKYNAKIDEANELIAEQDNDDEFYELAEFEFDDGPSDIDDHVDDFGDDLREMFGIAVKSKPETSKYAAKIGASHGGGLKPISDEELKVAKEAAEKLAEQFLEKHPHFGKMFELHGYRYLFAAEEDGSVLAVRARNGDMKVFDVRYSAFILKDLAGEKSADKPADKPVL